MLLTGHPLNGRDLRRFDERLRAAANGPDADAVVREAQAQFDEHFPMRDRYYALDDLLHGIVEAMRAYAANRDR